MFVLFSTGDWSIGVSHEFFFIRGQSIFFPPSFEVYSSFPHLLVVGCTLDSMSSVFLSIGKKSKELFFLLEIL